MKTYFLLATCILIPALTAVGQDLADVLSSIQERKRAVAQSQQVADHLPIVDPNVNSVTIADQELIEWTGLGSADFPTTAQVDTVGMDGKVALLNQAIMEFRNLQGTYANLRKEDLVSGEKIGVIRPFLPEDFPDLGRADVSNYHALLFALARDVRRLTVLPWPIGGLERTKRYWLDKREAEEFDENWEMVGIELLPPEGTESVSGWQPSSLGGGVLDPGFDDWNFTSVGVGGAWGSFLSEGVNYSAYSDSNHEEDDDYGEYDLRILKVEKDTIFHSQAALFSKVPNRSDQIDGTVAVVIRNEWTPVDMAKVSITAPNSWDPGDAGFDVAMVQVDPGSTYSFGDDPDISIDLDWVALGTSLEGPEDDWNDGIPFGYDATKVWLQGLAELSDPDWLIAWENQQGIGPEGIAVAKTTVFRRQLHGLCAPTIVKGLDVSGKAAKLDLAEKFAAPPAGDGQPVLHPVPGVLLGIPVGVGLDGSTSGFVGISPCEEDYVGDFGTLYPRSSSERLTTRFDYAANLRFVGPAQDFHVVYATSRDDAERGEGLPDEGPTDEEVEDTGNVSFFDAWDTPRLRQVISRDLFIDCTPVGHFKTEVKVYRRPQSAGAVDRTPGEVADPPAGSPIRTLVFENPDATSAPYPSSAEKVHVTDGTTIYKVWRDGYPNDSEDPDPAIRFSMVGGSTEHFSKVVEFPTAETAKITTAIDGNPLSVDTITIGSSYWTWWGGDAPGSVASLADGQTTIVTNTFDVDAPGSQAARYPQTTTISHPVEPEVSLEWMESGVLETVSSGPWSQDFSISSNTLHGEAKYNETLVRTVWVEWSNSDRTVRTFSAPDGTVTAKTDGKVAQTELTYGDAAGTGLPGLPHKLVRKNGEGGTDGSGATWDWTVVGGDATEVTMMDGFLSGEAVTQGTKTVVCANERGYVTETETFMVQGGNSEKLSGSAATAFSSWGAPKDFEDYPSGLDSSVIFDGSRERITKYTDSLGVESTFGGFDALNRPGSVGWNGMSGTAAYNSGGFGSSFTVGTISSSATYDAQSRLTAGSSSVGGIGNTFTMAHTATERTMESTDLATGATATTKWDTDKGYQKDVEGTAYAFDGYDGTAPTVDGGLLKTVTMLDGLNARSQTVWTDAWGRTRKIHVTSSTGTGQDETLFLYSDPDATTKRVEVRHASGKREIRESEPWNGSGVISRTGLDVNQNGVLDGGDRYITSTTELSGGKVMTTVEQTGNGTILMEREYDPSTGVVIMAINEGEETITETPNFAAKTRTIVRKRGTTTVSTSTVALNNLGQADSTSVVGTGMPAVTVNPTFRADGTVSAFETTVGGDTTLLSFDPDGTLAGMTVPDTTRGTNGVLSVSHGFAGGVETCTVDGTTATRSLDGTASSLTGESVMDREREIAVSGGGFAETIDPDEGASTVLASNASGAKTVHDYATGADLSSTWLAGGLPETVSLGRAGSLSYAYSADGARDLKSLSWPSNVGSAAFPSSALFPNESGLTYSVDLTYDEAGRIETLGDRSGDRDFSYEKNRLTSVDWTSGKLNDYQVDRAFDSNGRLDFVTLHRVGAAPYTINYGYNGSSSEISSVTTAGFTASYSRDGTTRRVTELTRGATASPPTVTQDWGRGTAGRITSAGSDVAGAPSFDYTGFDTKGRRETVATNKGTWTYAYKGGDGGDGQLASATGTGNDLGTYTYDFDGIGRRASGVGQGDPNQSDSLNQLQSFFHGTQQKHLYISLDPAATVRVNGVDVTPSPFNGFLSHPLASPGSSGGWVSWAVEGTLDQAGDYGSPPVDAVAEVTGNTWFPPEEESFVFDADGNRESSSLWDYGWDGRNRLVRARTVDWATAAEGWDLGFDYDAEGRRFKKEVTHYANGEVTDHKVIYFVWDGWDLVYERHEDANRNALLERKYVWGLDISGSRGGAGGAGGLLLMRETRGQTTEDYYPLYDGTGHVVGLSDDNGNLVAEYWWGPFGELIEAKGEMAEANPWRYATKYFDVETGLYYFGHRYYDPVTWQWLSRELLGESESLNLYAYCGNEPINGVDVLGLFDWRPWNFFGLLDPDPIVIHSELPLTERLARAEQGLDRGLMLEEMGRGVWNDGQYPLEAKQELLIEMAFQTFLQDEWNKTTERLETGPRIMAPDPYAHRAAAMCIGASCQSSSIVQMNEAFLLPTGALGFAARGFVQGARIGGLMATGAGSFREAVVISRLGGALRSGSMVSSEALELQRFIRSPQASTLLTHPAFAQRSPAGAGFLYDGLPGQMIAQPTANTCGPACGYQLLREIDGASVHLSNLTRNWHRGLEPADLAASMNRFGTGWTGGFLEGTARELSALSAKGSFVARIGGWSSAQGRHVSGHFVIVDNVAAGTVYLRDPAGGIGRTLSQADFLEIFTGAVWKR